jgi:hypothetical protein
VEARRRSCVVLPEPSRPSKVMKYPRGIDISLSQMREMASHQRYSVRYRMEERIEMLRVGQNAAWFVGLEDL